MVLQLDFEFVIKFMFLLVVLVGRVLALQKFVLNSEQFLVNSLHLLFLVLQSPVDLLESLSLIKDLSLSLPQSLTLLFLLLLPHQPDLLQLFSLLLLHLLLLHQDLVLDCHSLHHPPQILRLIRTELDLVPQISDLVVPSGDGFSLC